MDIHATLQEGKPRSLGRTDEVVSYVLTHSDRLDELFECVFDSNEIVRLRAGDALEKVCRQHPDWLEPYTDRLLSDVAAIPQPSVQWHLVQMIGELDLTPEQHARAIEILKRNLETATDWIVLNYSLEEFARFARADPSLQPYFVEQLTRQTQSRHKSVAKRATKLLATF